MIWDLGGVLVGSGIKSNVYCWWDFARGLSPVLFCLVDGRFTSQIESKAREQHPYCFVFGVEEIGFFFYYRRIKVYKIDKER